MPNFTVELPNGKRIVVDADDEAAALSGSQKWFADNYPDHQHNDAPDTSMLGALSQGASDVVTGVGKTVKDYISPSTGKAIEDKGASVANPRYKSASQQFIHPEDGADNHTLGLDWSQLPRAAVEQAPGLALDVAGQVLTKRFGPIGQYLANAVTYGARTLGSEAEKRAQARTGDQNAQPTAGDKLTGLESVLAQSALNKIGVNSIVNPAKVAATGVKGALQAGGNVAKAAAAEGLTNAGQDLVSQGFVKQGTDQPIDTQSALGAGVMGGLGGGVFSMPHAAKETITASRMRNQSADEHTAMAANRIVENAGGTDALADPTKAYEATSRAAADVNKEIGDAAKRVSNPSTEAANAIDAAKRGDVLSKKDLAAVDAEGNDQLSSLVRQSTALSKLTGLGNFDEASGTFVGGTHQTVKKLIWPFAKEVGKLGAVAGAASSGGVGFDTVAAHVPLALGGLAGAVAAYKGLKTLDKATGLASPAKTFAEKLGDDTGSVRVPIALNESPTGPKVTPQNSLEPAQPWGPPLEPSQPFKPDVLEPGIGRIVEKIQRQKQQQTARDAMPLLRQLAQDAQPQDAGVDANALNEQVKSALLMASARRKIAGQQMAEGEAEASPMIQDVGGLDAVRNPAMGKRANELISAANALRKLRDVPETDSGTAPTAPESPGEPESVPSGSEPFTLPESNYWMLEPEKAADMILSDALDGGKPVRNQQAYHAGTVRRLKAEEEIYKRISDAMHTVEERGAFHKYLAALWGSDSPEVVMKVRDQMMTEFPQHSNTILRLLPEATINGLWNTKPAKKQSR